MARPLLLELSRSYWQHEAPSDWLSPYLKEVFRPEEKDLSYRPVFHGEAATVNLEERDKEFQKRFKELIKSFDPKRGLASYSMVHTYEFFQTTTVNEMAALFGFSEHKTQEVMKLLQRHISVPYEKVFRTPSHEDEYQFAREYHVSYSAGFIERTLLGQRQEEFARYYQTLSGEAAQRALEKERVRLAKDREHIRSAVDFVMKSQEGNSLSYDEQTREKCHMLLRMLGVFFPQEHEGLDALRESFFKKGEGWLLSDLDRKNEITTDLNRGGDLATEAALAFYQNRFGVKIEAAIDQLSELLTYPDFVLEQWINAPDTTKLEDVKRAEVLQFTARAANLAWIESKVYQGCIEEHKAVKDLAAGEARKALVTLHLKNKGAMRYTPGEHTNPDFASFDRMCQTRGWSNVMIDFDQIRTGLRLRRAKYQRKGEA